MMFAHSPRPAGRLLALVACASLALGAPAVAATKKGAAPARAASHALPTKITSVEGITEYHLDNGLRVLLFPDPSKQTITVNVTYLVGSRVEGYGETGMAHLLEHMLFKGSTNHPNIPQELTSHGARPNGSTWFDRTNYFETFAASDENLRWAVEMEADRMVNSFVQKKDLESEFSVVRNEFEMGENSPSQILSERVWSTAYLWHNYGKSTIGSKSDIELVPVDRLKDFYRKFYQPDNAVLAIAGNIDEQKTLALVASTFGRLPRPTRVLPPVYTTEPAQDGERLVTLRRVGDTQVAEVGYHMVGASHADYPALDVLSFILGDTPSGRLHKALVESQKATSVSANAWPFRDPSMFEASCEVPKDKDLSAAYATLEQTVESFASTAPTTEEVERAKQAKLKDWDRTIQNSQDACLALSEWSAWGDWRLMFLYRDNMKTVKPEDVTRVASTYLIASNRTAGLFYPTDKPVRAQVPANPDIDALVSHYTGGAAIAQGESFDPTPENIDARTTHAQLASGLKIVTVAKKTRGETVNARLVLHLGDLASLKNQATAAGLVGSMLTRGTAQHTRQQLQDEFDKLKATVRIDGSAQQAFATIETTRENFPAALRLVAEVLKTPNFPATEFDLLKKEETTQAENAKSDPIQRGQMELARYLAPFPADDPRYTMTPDEQIAAINATTLDQVKAFHARFYGATSGELAVAGDCDPAAVKDLATELFGSWKAQQQPTRLASIYQDVPAKDVKVETPDKANAVFLSGQRIAVRDDDADYPALTLGNFMTGGGFLNSRITTRLRQKDGLSYGSGSFLQVGSWDKDGMFGSFAIYAPQNRDKLLAAYKEEIARVLKDGFTPEEIAEAKKGWLQSRQVSRSQDRELVNALANNEYVGRTMAFAANFEKQVTALTPEQIVAAMRKYIAVEKLTMVTAGDFANAAKAGTAGAPTGAGAK